jgi:Na+/H+ antiporter NhaD/arsenite permease-like protein
MPQVLIALSVFIACYILFVVFPRSRSVVACSGAAVLILSGSLPWREALFELISWNVIGLFFGTLILAELFLQSRMPAVLAEVLVRHTRTMRGAILAVCLLSGFLSIFVENVAVVLLVAPIALSLAEKLKINPVPLLICISACANLQGTATLIGDPPSMILAGYLKLTFNDFFVYHGKAGIFFAVQVGALATLAYMAFLFRRLKSPIALIRVEKVKSWTPTVFLLILVVGLSLTSLFDPGFKWLAGTFTLILAGFGLLWHRLLLKPRWGSTQTLIRSLDWDTTFFLIGVFVVVGALSESGLLNQVARFITQHLGSNLLVAYIFIIVLSVVVSAFVDNVPFLLAMIPVCQVIAQDLNAPGPLLYFGLLIGACLGGNITPIGASANIVTLGLLKKQGHVVRFGEFMRIGIPFTLVAVPAATLFVWWIWAP